MQWPQEIVSAFQKVPLTPKEGVTKQTVVQYLLDQAARYAVWRAKGDAKRLPAAYNSPYTPLGYLSATGFGGKVDNCTFDERWCTAVDALYAYVREHVQEIMIHYQAEAEAYPDGLEEEGPQT